MAAADRAAAALSSAETRLAWRVRARRALLQGEPAEAEKAYGELVRRYPNDAPALLDLAAAQTSRGAAATAVKTLERVTELDKADARAWLLLGRNMIQAGDARKAVADPLVRALTLMGQYGNEQGRGDVLNAMGVAYQRLGEYPQALAHYGEAAEIRARIGDERGTAVSRKNRAGIHLAMGQFAQAESDLTRARTIYARIGDRKGLADVWNDFGSVHEGRGAFTQARAAYQEALRLRRDLGDDQKLAQSYDNVGYVFLLEGEYESARVYWQQALDLHAKTGDRAGWVLTTQNMGFLHTAQGRWSEAAKAFLDALQVAREIDFKNAVAVSQGGLGVLQQYDGRYAAALAAFGDALGIMRELGDKRGLAEYTLREAAALLEIGQLAPAKARLDAAAQWVEETGNREQRADHETLLGEWHLARGESALAHRAFARAVELAGRSRSRGALLRARIASGEDPAATVRDAEALGNALLRIRAAETLARAELQRGRSREAQAPARQAVKAAERAGWRAGLFRLYALLARALELNGDAVGAAAARAESRRQLSGLRAGLPSELQASFDAVGAVREVAAGGPVVSAQASASPPR
jgi:tetratricopeptide (TPR) repeat protein